MKTSQWIASNVWIHFNISLLRVKYRDDKLNSGVQLLKVFSKHLPRLLCENEDQASLKNAPFEFCLLKKPVRSKRMDIESQTQQKL